MKELLQTQNLELVNEHIERYYKIVDQENVIKLECQIITRRYFWPLDVKIYIQAKIALKRDDSRRNNPDRKLKVVLKRWYEFDKENLVKWKKELEEQLLINRQEF